MCVHTLLASCLTVSRLISVPAAKTCCYSRISISDLENVETADFIYKSPAHTREIEKLYFYDISGIFLRAEIEIKRSTKLKTYDFRHEHDKTFDTSEPCTSSST